MRTPDRLLSAGRVALYATSLVPLVLVTGFLFPFVTTRTVFFRLLVDAGILVVVAALLTRDYRRIGGRDLTLVAFAAFVAIGLLSAFLSPAPFRSVFGDYERMWGAWGWFHLLAYYVLLRTLLEPRHWRRLLLAFVAVGAVVAATVVANYLFDVLPGFGGAGRRSGVMLGNAGYAAAYLLVSAAVGAYLAIEEERTWRRPLLLGFVVLALAAVLATETRAALVALAAGGLWAGVAVVLLGGGRPWRWWLAGTGLVLAAAGALILAGTAGLGPLPAARLFADPSTDPSVLLRLELAEYAWRGFLERPLLGWGPDNFGLVFGRFFDPVIYDFSVTATYADKAHNAFLEVLATHGALGLLAYLAIWVSAIAALLAAARSGRLSAAAAALLSGGLVAYMVHLAFWFEDLNTMALAVAVLAWSQTVRAGAPLLEFEPGRAPDRRRGLVLIVAVGAVVAAAWIHGVLVLRATRALDRATTARADIAVEDRLAAFRTAIAAPVPQRTHAVALLVDYVSGFRNEAAEIRESPYRTREIEAALVYASDALTREITRDPLNDQLYALAGKLLTTTFVLSGDPRHYQAAARSLGTAIELAPERLRYHDALAALHLGAGQLGEAERVAQQAIAIHEPHGESYYLLGLVALERADAAEAGRRMVQAAERGYRPEPEPFIRAGTALEQAGSPGAAADVYQAYLAPRADFGSTAPAGSGWRGLAIEEVAVATRLPGALLRAGREAEARRALARLRQVVPHLVDRVNPDTPADEVFAALAKAPPGTPLIPDSLLLP